MPQRQQTSLHKGCDLDLWWRTPASSSARAVRYTKWYWCNRKAICRRRLGDHLSNRRCSRTTLPGTAPINNHLKQNVQNGRGKSPSASPARVSEIGKLMRPTVATATCETQACTTWARQGAMTRALGGLQTVRPEQGRSPQREPRNENKTGLDRDTTARYNT